MLDGANVAWIVMPVDLEQQSTTACSHSFPAASRHNVIGWQQEWLKE